MCSGATKCVLAALKTPSGTGCAPGDAVCAACNGDGQCRAQQNALDAAWFFGKIAVGFAVLGIAFAPILGLPLGELTAVASYLAATFGREAGYPAAWFTVANISSFASSQIAAPLIAYVGLDMLGGLALAAFGAMVQVPYVSLPAYVVGAESFVAGFLSIGALASAMSYIYQQEALVDDGQGHVPPRTGPQ